MKGSGQDLFEGSITESCISLEGLRKTMKILGQHCQYPSWDSIWALLYIKDSEGLLLSENCLVCLNYDCTKWSEIPTQLFKNSGDFMHHQVSHSNILCSAHTVHLCTILWISEQIKQWLFPHIAFNGFYKCDKVCSLHGTNWIFKHNWRPLKDWCFYSRQCCQNHSRKLHMEDF